MQFLRAALLGRFNVNLIFILAIIGLAAAMVLGGLLVSRFIAPRIPGATKSAPYECGEKTFGTAQIQFNVAYYLFALLFLVFDVEAIFLYPWAVALRAAGWAGFFEVAGFILVLVLGLAYAHKKGALEWLS